MNILFLASDPLEDNRLRLDREYRSIDEKLQRSQNRSRFRLESVWAVRHEDLPYALLRFQPHIVHFSGHGSRQDGIILEDEDGNAHPVSPLVLANLFRVLKDNISCVVLNACWSANQVEAIANEVGCVVGMTAAIGDEAAILFASGFYEALGFGRSVKEAFELGRLAIQLASVPEDYKPKLLTGPGVDAERVVIRDALAGSDSSLADLISKNTRARLLELRQDIERTFAACMAYQSILKPVLGQQMILEPWFGTIPEHILRDVRIYYQAIEEYSSLKRGRGQGFIIERWIKNSNIEQKYQNAYEKLSEMILGGGI